MTTYSDRDYFDQRFKEIDDHFAKMEFKLDKIHKSIYGNGEIGLIEQVRKNQGHIRMAFLIIIGLLPIQIKESRDILISLIRAMIGF